MEKKIGEITNVRTFSFPNIDVLCILRLHGGC